MAKYRKKTNSAGALKALIGALTVILILVLIWAVQLNRGSEEPAPSTQSPEPSTTAPTETDPPQTTAPTETTLPPPEGWVEEDGHTCYYENGVRVTGLKQLDGSLYLFSEDGALMGPGWQEFGDRTYYLNEDSTLYCGWLELGDGLYYLHSDGHMARGETQIDGKTYFFTSTGRHIYVVNPWNYVPEGYDPTLVKLSSSIAGDGMKVDESCYDALVSMMADCKAAGHNVYIISAYRTQAYQEYLFNRQVQKQIAAFGYTQEEAEIAAAAISAVPGTSEHQLGLAVDIIDTQIWDLVEEQEDLAGQQWLMEHCHEYGFILRYPKNKTDVTGIIYEPWHYRYVGTQLAAELHASGLTLEEYLAGLTE